MPRSRSSDRDPGETVTSSSTRSSSKKRSSSTKRSKKGTTRRHHKEEQEEEEANPDLVALEERLTDDVDDEFFQDPRKFHTLHRVIDVLGMQLTLTEDGEGGENSSLYGDSVGGGGRQSTGTMKRKPRRSNASSGHLQQAQPRIERNPAYRALAAQRRIVDDAIEHLALIHCADLNGAVVQVGRVARQFQQASGKVQRLRHQVKDIQDTLGTGGSGSTRSRQKQTTVIRDGIALNAQTGRIAGAQHSAATVPEREAAQAAMSSAMSLRELWLKKLEAEAVLAVLDKLDTIRAAPRRFDALLHEHRIGAAVVTVAVGLETMFMSDVNQVQALHKIMEQLMLRKQKAEDVVWEVLADVIFLRTGNGTAQLVALGSNTEWDALFGGSGGSTTQPPDHHNKKLRPPGGRSSQHSLAAETNSILQGGDSLLDGGGRRGDSSSSMATTSSIGATTSSVVSGSTTTTQRPQQQHAGVGGSTSLTHPVTAAAYLWNLPPSGWDYIRRQQAGMVNPFLTVHMRFALDPDDLQLESRLRTMELQQRDRDRGQFSDLIDEDLYDDEEEEHRLYGGGGGGETASSLTTNGNDGKKQSPPQQNETSTHGRLNAVIPVAMLDAEFDLEADERRSLEEQQYDRQGRRRQQALHMTKPTYLDHVIALRTFVECLVRLRRLDDVERIVTEVLERELSQLVQREQARTYLWVAQHASTERFRKGGSGGGTGGGGRYAALVTKAGSGIDLREFRRHLNHILSAFGNVQIRLIHLTQIIRHRINNEKQVTGYSANGSVALRNLLVNARSIMERELKSFLNACLMKSKDDDDSASANSLGQSRTNGKNASGKRSGSSGLFSLGIIDKGGHDDTNDANHWMSSSASSRRSTIQTYTTSKFVVDVLFSKTTQNGHPQIRHALFFRKALAKWQRGNDQLRYQLAVASGEDTSTKTYLFQREQPALEYLDNVIQKQLLPVLQKEAVDGTVHALERQDAFDPVLDRNVYARVDSNEPQDVDMCKACTALYNFTGPLFLALHRLPKGGDMYLPLVAVLEHVILTFISRVKQQVSRICNDKTALQLLMDSTAFSVPLSATGSDKQRSRSFGQVMERRKAFAQLVLAYADGDLLEAVNDEKTGELAGVPSILAPPGDTPRGSELANKIAGMEDLDFEGGVEREETNLSVELAFVRPYLEFAGMELAQIKTCSDPDLMKAACLAHSLLKLASLLDSRLKVRSRLGITSTKALTNTRALREAIKTIKANGLKMAKFCRSDILLQSITRLCKVCNSSTIVARDAVRIPSSINDLGEYMTAASDNLREASGNAVTAYAFSTLEQYIPLCIIQTVRVLAAGKGVIAKAPLTMNGIEALDRSGSVLYRDLKAATSFDNSFWDIELAAVSFERSASFIAMMELEMPELEAYYQENRRDFTEEDFKLMFAMNGPRRKGDGNRYHLLVKTV